VLPSGSWIGKNYLAEFEGTFQPAYSTAACDVELLEHDLRVAYDTVCAPEAWHLAAEADVRLRPVRIAVVDTGIAADHSEFVIPLRGRSYVSEEDGLVLPWCEDSRGHGTQISGIIGAENGQGRMNGMLAGVAGQYEMQVYRVIGDLFSLWDCCRLAVSTAEEELGSWRTAVEDSRQRQSVVVNISLGWDLAILDDETEARLVADIFRDIFTAHPKVLFVTSAGNGDHPDDLRVSAGRPLGPYNERHAPGGIMAENNLTVAATDPTGTKLATWSNYGTAVDLAAPGQDIYTTDSDGSYVWRLEGTSYAAALVAGAAATIRAIDPRLTPLEVKRILMSSPSRVITPDGSSIPVLDFADAVQRAIEGRRTRDRTNLILSSAAGAATLLLGLLLLHPF
jgi:subtilisin family serine protease